MKEEQKEQKQKKQLDEQQLKAKPEPRLETGDAPQPRGGLEEFVQKARFLKEYIFTPQNLSRAGELGVELGGIISEVVLFVNEMRSSGQRSLDVESRLYQAGCEDVIRQLRTSD